VYGTEEDPWDICKHDKFVYGTEKDLSKKRHGTAPEPEPIAKDRVQVTNVLFPGGFEG
jgi:hypothetical protein